MDATEEKPPIQPRTAVMKQLYVLGQLLTQKFGDHLGDNGIEMRRKLLDRLEELAEKHNAKLRSAEAKIRVPSDSSLKNFLGMNPNYYEETQTASMDHRSLLAQAAAFKGWSDYVEQFFQVHSYLQEAALAPRSVFEKLVVWIGGLGVVVSLMLFREPGSRIGLHMGWAWMGLALLLLGLGMVLGFRMQIALFTKTETVWRPDWMRRYMKLFPSRRYLRLCVAIGFLMVFQLFQAIYFRPVRFALAPEEFGRLGAVVLHQETRDGLRPLLRLEGETASTIWMPVGTTGLLINYEGHGYPIGDRLNVPIGWSTLQYTFP